MANTHRDRPAGSAHVCCRRWEVGGAGKARMLSGVAFPCLPCCPLPHTGPCFPASPAPRQATPSASGLGLKAAAAAQPYADVNAVTEGLRSPHSAHSRGRKGVDFVWAKGGRRKGLRGRERETKALLCPWERRRCRRRAAVRRCRRWGVPTARVFGRWRGAGRRLLRAPG